MTTSGYLKRALPLLTSVLCLTNCANAIDDTGIGRIGAFHVGGTLVNVNEANIDASASGTVYSEQLMVRYILPDEDLKRPAVIMMPGYGLASDIYLETPDGREGWALDFARAGFPVYLVDPSGSVRAGVNPEAFNGQIRGRSDQPTVFFTWTRELAIPRFGFGNEDGELFENGLLEKNSIEELVKMFTPMEVPVVNKGGMIAKQMPANIAGIGEIIEHTGPAILLVHSATGVPGFAYTEANPEKVLAVVNIEPVGCPAESIDKFPNVPVLSMFADYMEVRPQMPVRQDECQALVDALKERGVTADMLALPEMGIKGNSHLPMSELNSAELASLMIAWLRENIL